MPSLSSTTGRPRVSQLDTRVRVPRALSSRTRDRGVAVLDNHSLWCLADGKRARKEEWSWSQEEQANSSAPKLREKEGERQTVIAQYAPGKGREGEREKRIRIYPKLAWFFDQPQTQVALKMGFIAAETNPLVPSPPLPPRTTTNERTNE